MRSAGRQEWMEAAATGAAYLAAALLALAFTRFEGGAACLWVAGAVLLAKLGVTRRRHWGPVLLACGAANVVAAATVGAGPWAAVPLSVLCLGEGVVAALMLRRLRGRDDGFDTVADLGVIVLCSGLVAPALAATPAAAILSWATGTPYGHNWMAWYTGHALGTLTFCPVLTLIFSGEARRWLAEAGRARLGEAAAVLGLVAVVSVAVFAQSAQVLLFLPALPVMLATFRIGRLGAASAVVVIAVVGGWLTARGIGPIGTMSADATEQARFFQFYLAATVLTALPAAVELRRQRALYDRLRDSEARYRLLADNSSDIVLNVGTDGLIGYASPSATRLGGYTPEELLGRLALDLVHPDDRGAVMRAHRDVLGRPDVIVAAEYRLPTAWGEERWFESHSRGVRDADGRVSGVVSAIRDITGRKAVEAELARAAATDPLTGLANRRVFDAALDRMLASGGPGCVAIFDLDHFKAVNDRFGHEGGDRVLRAFAAVARAAVRDGDVVARLGGEEFGVLLPGTAREQASVVCERLRVAAAEAPVLLPGGLARVTASAGLAEGAPGVTASDLMRAADEALYRAKTGGRDRLSLAA